MPTDTGYRRLDYQAVLAHCRRVFTGMGFSPEESKRITDVLLEADLRGFESHGVQRLVRYWYEVKSGMVDLEAKPEVVFGTPISAVVEGRKGMGQLVGTFAMEMAIRKAQESGIGLVAVRNSNHYGIAGYYTHMAAERGLMGISMTNTEAIMVPTFGRQPMLGTNPIALAMPAKPVIFSFDASTTVVPRGKLEVYNKRGDPLPSGWALDETGAVSENPATVLDSIIQKRGGGILPLGGAGEEHSGYKGYGFGMVCEIFTGILSGGLTSDRVNRTPGHTGIAHFLGAMRPDLFGDGEAIIASFSEYLERIRRSDAAQGQQRIYVHGEKEAEARLDRVQNGIPVNAKTYEELNRIGQDVGAGTI